MTAPRVPCSGLWRVRVVRQNRTAVNKVVTFKIKSGGVSAVCLIVIIIHYYGVIIGRLCVLNRRQVRLWGAVLWATATGGTVCLEGRGTAAQSVSY